MAKKVSIKVLKNDYYDGIRGLIAPDITNVHISNQYLSQLPFVPAAEREVRRRLAADGIDVDALTGEAREDAILAMMHECAALLCLTAPQLLRQMGLQVSTEVQRIDWKEKREFHLSQVDSKINDVKTNADSNGTPPTPGGRPPGSPVGAGRTRLNPFGAVGTKRRDDSAVCPISRRG
ncbi:MAG: hypothetical protein OXU23_00915 [Candidatus Poribacteria bacterium]|nr:hypothetical protein [Candidatus Poribacteria bacterium]